MNTTKFMLSIVSIALLAASQPTLAEKDAPHWTYEGEEGPEHWGELANEFNACAEGMSQSPVNLVANVHADLPLLEFDYYSSPLREVNNGHTIQQNVQPGSYLKLADRGISAELKQFHFHSPSEHQVNGKSYAMELHFVHVTDDGSLVVVGVLMDEGEEHPVLKKLWSFIPKNAGDTSEEAIGIEETNLLPATQDYFSYGGSLTTPPCSEGVKWFVLKTPIEASAEQIAIFKENVGEANNRPIQPHNARIIVD